MNSDEILEQVAEQVEQWKRVRSGIGQFVELTPKAIKFLSIMIENIDEDKSDNWDYSGDNPDPAQKFAISLIPNALNEVVRNTYPTKNIRISSWEIWHSMSRIINGFCFIPKKRP